MVCYLPDVYDHIWRTQCPETQHLSLLANVYYFAADGIYVAWLKSLTEQKCLAKHNELAETLVGLSLDSNAHHFTDTRTG